MFTLPLLGTNYSATTCSKQPLICYETQKALKILLVTAWRILCAGIASQIMCRLKTQLKPTFQSGVSKLLWPVTLTKGCWEMCTFMVGWLWLPIQPLSYSPLLNRMREKEEDGGVHGLMGITCQLPSWAKQTLPGGNGFSSLPIKYIWMVRNKDKIELPFTSPFSQAQLRSFIPSSSVSCPLQVTQTDGSGRLWSVHSSPSCFSVGFPHGLQFFRTNLLQHGLSINHSSFIKYPHAPVWVPPWATAWVSALVWSFPWAAGEYLLWPLEHLLSPFFSHLDAHRAASHTYFSSFLMWCFALSWTCFPRGASSMADVSAVSCGGCGMELCVWHRAAPGLFSLKPPLQSLPPLPLKTTKNLVAYTHI